VCFRDFVGRKGMKDSEWVETTRMLKGDAMILQRKYRYHVVIKIILNYDVILIVISLVCWSQRTVCIEAA
jgi:hypothetical protein